MKYFYINTFPYEIYCRVYLLTLLYKKGNMPYNGMFPKQYLFYSFEPLSRCVLTRYFNSQMRKPAIISCSMPMFYTSRNINTITWLHKHRVLAPFLIIAFSTDTNQYLSTTILGMMDMPVVFTTRFKCNIVNADL